MREASCCARMMQEGLDTGGGRKDGGAAACA